MQVDLSKSPAVPYFRRPDYLQGSAFEGTIRTSAGERLVMLPEDLIRGLHKAIEFETGRALPIITYTCGRRWGQRVVGRWTANWERSYNGILESADYTDFEAWLKDAFRFHGWGDLAVDFSLATHGMVEFRIANCVLPRLLADLETTMVADIFAGLFASLVSSLVGRELECAQVACEKSGAPACRFLVATGARVERARQVRMDGGSTEQIISSMMEV